MSWPSAISRHDSGSSRMPKIPPAAFSHHSEARRTEAYASPHRSLRPCWTALLSILRCRVPQFLLSSCTDVGSRNHVFQQIASPTETDNR